MYSSHLSVSLHLHTSINEQPEANVHVSKNIFVLGVRSASVFQGTGRALDLMGVV